MFKANDISNFINSIAPFSTQCSWDNSGFIIGDKNKDVQTLCFALDLTDKTLEDAQKNGADMLITHHPAMFHAQKNLLADDVSFKAAAMNLAVVCAHTCFDCALGGVNDVLANLLGLEDIGSISSSELVEPMLRCGKVKKLSSLNDFAASVAKVLSTTVRVVQSSNEVNKVAVCGGAGMSFVDDVINFGCDTFVTGDISHHEMLDANHKGLNVVAAGHFETEFPAMKELSEKVQQQFPQLNCILIEQKNPVCFINGYGT